MTGFSEAERALLVELAYAEDRAAAVDRLTEAFGSRAGAAAAAVDRIREGAPLDVGNGEVLARDAPGFTTGNVVEALDPTEERP